MIRSGFSLFQISIVVGFVVLNVLVFQNCGGFHAAGTQLGSTVQDSNIPGPGQLGVQSYACLPDTLRPPVMPSHLQYYGQYFSLTLPQFNRSFAAWQARLDEMVGQGNYTSVSHLPQELFPAGVDVDRLFADKLAYARLRGFKVSLELTTIFFGAQPSLKALDLTKLRPDYLARWQRVRELIRPYQDAIAAFYPLDEPYWNASAQGVSAPSIQKYFEIINDVVKRDFPSIPIAFVEAYKMVNANLVIPRGVDWVGMDCYGSFDRCGDPGEEKSIPEYYRVLKSKMQAGQRLIAIPEGLALLSATYAEEIEVAKRAKQYMDYIASEPLFIVAAAFVFHGEEEYKGSRDMCAVRELYHGYFSSRSVVPKSEQPKIEISCPAKVALRSSGTCSIVGPVPSSLAQFYWTVDQRKELSSDNFSSYTWVTIPNPGRFAIQIVAIDKNGQAFKSNSVFVTVD